MPKLDEMSILGNVLIRFLVAKSPPFYLCLFYESSLTVYYLFSKTGLLVNALGGNESVAGS